MLSTMTKSGPLRFTLFSILKTEEGGRDRHPFGFLLIQLLLCLMVFLPEGMPRESGSTPTCPIDQLGPTKTSKTKATEITADATDAISVSTMLPGTSQATTLAMFLLMSVTWI